MTCETGTAEISRDALVRPSTLRQGSVAALAQALLESRRDTLATFDAFEAALGQAHTPLAVPYAPELNPPLWELGHIAWFQRWWLGRNPQRAHGWRADPAAPRSAARAAGADELFDSSHVEHASRWHLRLPSAAQLRQEMALGLQETLGLLAELADRVDATRQVEQADAQLYFFRLALAHEDMHHEAALYMAQALGLPLTNPRWRAPRLTRELRSLHFPAGRFDTGHTGPGFHFDNEAGCHGLNLQATDIDSRVVSWNEYLPFVEDHGYQNPRWWTEAGQAWLRQSRAAGPRYLHRNADAPSGWQVQQFGRWTALDLQAPACHLNAFEAQAWCRWAGRALPSEAQWERAAVQDGAAFEWGAVWEWTSSPFAPYPGFEAHPYRDYSAPWFGTRQVLRGASFGTQARLHHARYRNYYTPERNDIFAGFRSCAA